MYKICLPALLSFLALSCSNRNEEVSIFSIPTDATPFEFKKNGFRVERDLNFWGKTDSHHHGEVEGCYLDLGYATVSVSYAGDTTVVDRYAIFIDRKPFEKMTGFKAKKYRSLTIEGYKYQVDVTKDNLSLILKRLGL